jgi:signal recognition particle subunit SRP54
MGRLSDVAIDDGDMVRLEAIIRSMTPGERADPRIISGSRRARIARGSGTQVREVNELLKQFDVVRKMMKQMTRGAKGKRKGAFSLPPGFGF